MLNKLPKSTLIIIILTVLFIATGLIYNYFSEKEKQKADEEDWFENEFLPKEFAGKIRKLEIKDQSDCLAEIRIVTIEDSVSYLLDLCKNPDLFKFTKEGDSLYKTANSANMKVVKNNGEEKEFNFPLKLSNH